MRSHSFRWLSPSAIVGAAVLLGGCGGYVSEYVPPPDGLPRPVASGDTVNNVIGTPIPAQCSAEIDAALGGVGNLPSGAPRVTVWSPTVVVVHAGGPRRVHAPGAIGRPTTVVHGRGGGSAGPIRSHGGSSGGSGVSGLGGGGGSGGSGDLGKAAVVVAVAALLTLPFISLGLAVGRPEPEGEVAAVIDQVNIHRDLARSVGSPCDAVMVQAVEQVSP